MIVIVHTKNSVTFGSMTGHCKDTGAKYSTLALHLSWGWKYGN